MQKSSIAKSGIVFLALCLPSLSHGANIVVDTTSMVIDVNGAQFITLDPAGRSGLYQSSTLTVDDVRTRPDLNDVNNDSLPATSDNPDGRTSLPEAIIAANNTPGTDTIILMKGETYSISTPNNYWYGPTALPSISSAIIIRGDGHNPSNPTASTGAIIERNSSALPMRLFHVMSFLYTGRNDNKAQVQGGLLGLQRLTLRNGQAIGGNGSGGGAGLGGAILNQGILHIAQSLLTNNTAQGGEGLTTDGIGGGGLSGAGIAGLGGGFFQQGFVGTENTGSFTSIFGGNGGANGSGGFTPTSDNGINGGGKRGGTSATLNSHTNNGAFGAGGGRPAKVTGEDGNGGAFGSGGGQGLTGGMGGFGAGGGKGATGGAGGTAGFAGGSGSITKGGGGAGLGGAIFNLNGAVVIGSSTISGNSAIGGAGANGGSGYGAGIFNLNGITNVYSSTIYDNSCTAGAGDIATGECNSEVIYTMGAAGDGIADGIRNGNMTVANNILLNNDATDPDITNNKIGATATSTLTLVGKNLVRNSNSISTLNSTTTSFLPSNLIQGDPQLGALQNNGGLTSSHLPNSSNALVVDNGINDIAIQTGGSNSNIIFLPLTILGQDQRGISRQKAKDNLPSSPNTTDLGAVELGPNLPPVVTIPVLSAPDTGSFNIPDSLPYAVASLAGSCPKPEGSTAAAKTVCVDDPDAPGVSGLELKITLTSTNGVMSFAAVNNNTIGITFDPANQNSGTNIVMQGNLTAINNALGNLVFTPDNGFTSTASTKGTIQILADDLGNSGTPNTALTDTETASFNIIQLRPAVNIYSDSSVTNNSSFTAFINFSEPVSGFSASDINITNAQVTSVAAVPAGARIKDVPLVALNGSSSLVERVILANQVFAINVLPSGAGDITINIPADVVTDGINLGNTAATQRTISYDVGRPSISTSGIPSRTRLSAFTATFTFSENVNGFTQQDINIANATLSNFTEASKSRYSATITPNGGGGVTISIDENVAADSIGNGNTALSEILVPLERDGGSSGSFSPYYVLCFMLLLALRYRNPD